MIDRPGDARNHSANIVPLGEFFEDSDPHFRQAVVNALAAEGFDTEERLPNIQIAREILDAIQWLEHRGHGNEWKRFESALRAADERGILVDMGAFNLSGQATVAPQ